MIEKVKKFPLIIGLATLFIIVVGVFLFSRGLTNPSPATFPPLNYEYFWGEGCPHCANVENFFSSWKGKDKINIEKKEIYLNKENAVTLAERAHQCGISSSNIGIPFLVTPIGECISGDTPIIEYFQGLNL